MEPRLVESVYGVVERLMAVLQTSRLLVVAAFG